ncbi:MAG TPA: thioester oxidase [Planctomycetes bacterium]|nr:thioester oxidase [Planctomycetota bacterium]
MTGNEDAKREDLRDFLKDNVRLRVDFSRTPQQRGVPPPPLEKPFDPAARRIDLPRRDAWRGIGKVDLADAIERRESRRAFERAAIALEELAFLLWATQGVKKRFGDSCVLRTVPSAGARHALETYLVVFAVEGLEPGVYRYLPLEHQLLFEFAESDARRKVSDAALGQTFAGEGAACFVWTAIPYRMEWRYGEASYKVIAIDAGHVCQNLYLACESIGAGTCAIAAYDQQAVDALLRVDGVEEFAVYVAPVGKVAR